MTETPNPTPQEIRAARLSRGGRVSIAQDEIVRRLELLMPGAINDFNIEQNLTAKNGVQGLKSIEAAPAIISDSFLGQDAAGKAFVALDVAISPLSAGATYRCDASVTVSIIDAPIQNAHLVRMSWERIELLIDCLFPLMSNCVDAQGRLCWKILEPTGYGRLGEEIKKWSGVRATFSLLQAPGASVFPEPI